MMIRTLFTRFAWMPALAMALASQTASAQDASLVPDAKDLPKAEFGELGWNPWVTIGGTVSFGHNRKVVGTLDGQSWTIGLSLDAGFDYQKNGHDWRNNLYLLESFTYGPPINEFIKSADQLTFESIYYYKIASVPWLGPFARFKLDTAIFPNSDVRESNTNNWELNGKVIHSGKRFKLTSSGFPLTLKESAGLFARPYSRPEIEWEFRVGAGAQEVFADGQYAISDDSSTPNIEVALLHDYQQVGAEAGMSFNGAVYDNKFTYKAWIDVLFPLYRSDKQPGDDMNVAEAANIEIGTKLSFKLVSWASLDYDLRVVRQPQLLDDWQVSNLLMLTFKYSPVEKKTVAPEEKAKK
ncbi:MAG: DUF3078 domain-containing protein [Deltaproteobacteria bacterium]|nr:DUF3078 domain-containing protein [Deltaproteobacteria bacterium]